MMTQRIESVYHYHEENRIESLPKKHVQTGSHVLPLRFKQQVAMSVLRGSRYELGAQRRASRKPPLYFKPAGLGDTQQPDDFCVQTSVIDNPEVREGATSRKVITFLAWRISL